MVKGENLPWNVEILEDNADCVAVRFSVICRKYPFYVERIMRFYSNQSEVHSEEKVKNLSEEDFHFMWGDGLKNAVENGSAVYMEPHGEKNFSMIFRVFEKILFENKRSDKK